MFLETKQKANKLIYEKSPYLLQHAYNPIDWYPWGEEAFAKAKEEDKPVFFSCGYSTCHWCHVMAHESFEDDEIAKLLNDVFVSIKVDREERPDIDNVYMTVCQMMTGSGGWPLTIIMTPDKKPFFAATYIPKISRYGRIGLVELTTNIEEQWVNKREKLLSTANKITNILKNSVQTNSLESPEIDINIFKETYNELKIEFDDNYGGFGHKPKFPIPHQGIFLLNYYTEESVDMALEMVEKTLQNMRAGGIYDHIGYGFHRYSTDNKWFLPHFEKMLYDQALLLYLYTTVYQITKKEIYKTTVDEIVEYTKNKLTSEEGGFYSAEDADSEGEEGKFYLWNIGEINNILGENADNIIQLYNLDLKGNYYDESSGKRNGKNILYLNSSRKLLEEFKKESNYTNERKILYKKREERIHPHKDDKILTDWNGLMIAALVRASFVFNNELYKKLAIAAVDFIIENLSSNGGLLHRYRDGEAAIEGTIDDYSFFIWGLIELYQSTYDYKYLDYSIKLNDYLLKNFWDNEKGGFFIVAKNVDDLIIRNKEVYDGAIPSGNSIALWNLISLSHLTGKHELEERAYELINAFSRNIKSTPTGYTQFLNGLQSILYSYYDLIIIGNKDDHLVQEIHNFLRENYKANLSIILIPENKDSSNYKNLAKNISFIKNYKQIENKATVYICKNYRCKLPVTEIDQVINILTEDKTGIR